MHFFDIGISKQGLIQGGKIERFLLEFFGDARIEDSALPLFIQVNDLEAGKEVYLDEGSVAGAVQAAMSLPGIFHTLYSSGTYICLMAAVMSWCRLMFYKRMTATILSLFTIIYRQIYSRGG